MGIRRTSPDPLRIVAIGGGTGLSTLLHGLKQYMNCGEHGIHGANIDITAVVTVTDDGGSSGRLRRDFAMLPPGDIRNCLVAMSEDEAMLARLFQYRFDSGKGLKGHSLGNLFLTALTDLTGDFATAVQHASDVLATCGRIYPSTATDVILEATLADGTTVEGETRISKSRQRIHRIRLKPARVKPMQETLDAIAQADLITLGPGSLFTSIVPNLLVRGISNAIAESPALKLCFINLMGQPGETIGLTAAEHVEAIHHHAGVKLVDLVAVNTTSITSKLQQRYARKQASPVLNDFDRLEQLKVKVIARPLAVLGVKVRHDPQVIADIAIHAAGEGRRKRAKALRSAARAS
jgi:uncharacterized cofD-like protein